MTTGAAMGFIENQEQAKRASGSLIFYFTLGFLGVIASLTLATMLILLPLQPFYMPPPGKWAFYEFRWILLGVTLAAAGAMLLASWWKLLLLKRNGGETIATMLGGRLVRRDTTEPIERRLRNVVEEIAIASQTPLPLIYILNREQGINAFTAGYTPHQAVLGITRGAAELLRRDQLQAMVAHEFSHIQNGDMRLNLRLMGLVHGILFLAYSGHVLLKHSAGARADHEGGFIPGLIFGAILALVGSVGGFCGTLLKAGVGRQREFLADAAAVEYTRDPKALVGVLLTIAGCDQGSELVSPKAPVASHLYFADGVNSWLSRKLATHPPLEERIRRIDPFYEGPWPKDISFSDQDLRDAVLRQTRAEMAGFAGLPSPLAPHTAEKDSTLSEAVQKYMRHARRLLDMLPREVVRAARSNGGAPTLLCAMILARAPEKDRPSAEDALLAASDVAFFDSVQELADQLRDAPLPAFLPLLDTALPTLHGLPEERQTALRERLAAIMAANRRIELFEWMVDKIVARQLPARQAQTPPPAPRTNGLRLAQAGRECGVLLSAMAHWGAWGARSGSNHADDASQAYAAGVAALGQGPDLPEEVLEKPPGLREVDNALRILCGLTPPGRQKLLQSCAACILQDNKVSQAQGELLRGASAMLDCPVPPLLPGQPLFERP